MHQPTQDPCLPTAELGRSLAQCWAKQLLYACDKREHVRFGAVTKGAARLV